jgi:hypothetical protein
MLIYLTQVASNAVAAQAPFGFNQIKAQRLMPGSTFYGIVASIA